MMMMADRSVKVLGDGELVSLFEVLGSSVLPWCVLKILNLSLGDGNADENDGDGGRGME